MSPGPVETPILKQFRDVLGDARVDSDIARVGRAGTAGDIAPVVLFLCSDGARWINGANVAGRRRPRSLDQRRGSRLLDIDSATAIADQRSEGDCHGYRTS